MVEHNNSSRYNDNKGKRKHYDNTKANPNKKSKVTCWKCEKPGHLKKYCKCVKVGKKANGSGTNGSVDGYTNSLKGATVHVCKDRCWFKTYESLNDGSILHMGNESTTLMHGRGCIDLKLNIVNDNIASVFMSTSKLNDSILWHVHFKRMQDMSMDKLIPAFNMDTEKTESRVLRALVRLIDPKLKTLSERGIECIFVGYVEHSKLLVPRLCQRSLVNETEDIGCLMVPKEITEEEQGIRSLNNTPIALILSCKPLGCKYIFKIKPKIDGTIEKFKTRLVIQGFIQKSGIDYFDTYVVVACINTIRLLISMASIHNLVIHQMDVNIAFLNGDLDEEAPKQWHQKFDKVVFSNGYLLNEADKCVDLTKEFFSSRFSMKDMGEADVILGIKIKHESNGITIFQSHYIEKVLKKFNYFDCTILSSPIDTSEKLMPNNGQAVS
ncbi:zinc finger, CCHC-type containing protein [Tanacetum coccineum]